MDVVFWAWGHAEWLFGKILRVVCFFSFKILKKRAENRGEVINSAEIKNFQDVFV